MSNIISDEELEREMPPVEVVGAPTKEICDSLTALFEISRGDAPFYMAMVQYFVRGAGRRTTHPFVDPVFALLLGALHDRSEIDSRVLPAWRRVIDDINSYGSFREFFLNCRRGNNNPTNNGNSNVTDGENTENTDTDHENNGNGGENTSTNDSDGENTSTNRSDGDNDGQEGNAFAWFG